MDDRSSEEFFRIVEGIDLDVEFPDVPGDDSESAPESQTPTGHAAEHSDPEPDYRRVGPSGATPRPRDGRLTLAWSAIIGPPLLFVLATMGGVILPRPVVLSSVLIFVAATIYLISRLPEHGPGQSDWPDDGAVL